jgi:hypothetical protein
VPIVYVIIATPAAAPVTAPVVDPTVATTLLLLVQVPPPLVLVNVTVLPIHTLAGPVIAAGTGFTVIGVVLLHPVGKVYVIETTPAPTPVTTPVVEPTIAIEVEPLAHVPPPGEAKVILAPTHTAVGPVIAEGRGFTVIVLVA